MENRGLLRVVLAFAALLASLALVVHRQSDAYRELRALEMARTERAMLESERSRLTAAAQRLESRSRIAGVTAAWWGMRVPSTDEEFVIILRPAEPVRAGRRAPARIARASLLPVARPVERD